MGALGSSGWTGAGINKGWNDMKRREFSYEELHPKCRRDFQKLALRMEQVHRDKLTPHRLLPFEGYRSVERQLYLLNVTKTTKAGPWESAHNYGLSVDYVPFDPARGGWYWPDADDYSWKLLRIEANNLGLWNEIAWDRPHVEHPVWRAVRSTLI